MIRRNEVVKAFEKTSAYARQYVIDPREELERKYGRRFLAIAENAGVIDSDENRFSLIKRLQKSDDQRSILVDNIANLTKPKLYNN